MVVVMTDGEENSSVEWRAQRGSIKNIINAMEADGCEFTFFGANIDAFAEAESLGLARGSTVSYAATSKGVGGTYIETSERLLRTRGVSTP